MSALKIAHLFAGAALFVFAAGSGAWMLCVGGVALVTLGLFGMCPMVRIVGRLQR